MAKISYKIKNAADGATIDRFDLYHKSDSEMRWDCGAFKARLEAGWLGSKPHEIKRNGVDPVRPSLRARVHDGIRTERDPKGSQARLEPLPGIHQSLRILNPTSRIESITAGVSRPRTRARANPGTKRRNDNTIKPTRARATM